MKKVISIFTRQPLNDEPHVNVGPPIPPTSYLDGVEEVKQRGYIANSDEITLAGLEIKIVSSFTAHLTVHLEGLGSLSQEFGQGESLQELAEKFRYLADTFDKIIEKY